MGTRTQKKKTQEHASQKGEHTKKNKKKGGTLTQKKKTHHRELSAQKKRKSVHIAPGGLSLYSEPWDLSFAYTFPPQIIPRVSEANSACSLTEWTRYNARGVAT